ncbi:hypothetical protein [Streptomyces adustus]|uniref:hypothetical protein n=1 Tax=Streptomyces adustus TaxID=1609272 RepID=UPI00371FF280
MPDIGIPERVVDLLPGALLISALVVLARELSRGSGRDVRTPWVLSAVAAIILANLLWPWQSMDPYSSEVQQPRRP